MPARKLTITAMCVIVGSLSIATSLMTTVVRKTREIGVFASMGASGRRYVEEHFDRRQLADRYRALLTSLLRPLAAVERPGIHLGVWSDGGAFHLWGATRTIPPLCLVLEVVEPGLVHMPLWRPDMASDVGEHPERAALKTMTPRTMSAIKIISL